MRMLRIALSAVAALTLLTPLPSQASSHREAPMIIKDPSIDGADLYAWRRGSGADATVVIVANYFPDGVPASGPNFYRFDESALYEIRIDNNGDAVPDVTWQFTFTYEIQKSPLKVPPASPGDSFLYAFAPVTAPKDDPNLLMEQTMSVVRVQSGKSTPFGSRLPVAPWNVGHLTTPDYERIAEKAINTLGEGRIKVFAGPRDDPFFIDLHRTFDFLDYTTDRKPSDDRAGKNILSIVLEVPATMVTKGFSTVSDGDKSGKYKLGIWTTASRQKTTVRQANGTSTNQGPWVQASRLGNPLINEVIVPAKFKDFFNASEPKDDLRNFGKVVLDPELPYLLQAKGLIPKVPPAPRVDLVKALATQSEKVVAETLHLDLAVPPTANENRLGAAGGDPAGFPNGRRLADDAADISLKAVGGAFYKALGAQAKGDDTDYATPASKLGDGVDANDVPFKSTFPYLATPFAGNP